MVEPNNSQQPSPGIPDHSQEQDPDSTGLYEAQETDFADNGNKHHQDSLQEESTFTAAGTAKLGADSMH